MHSWNKCSSCHMFVCKANPMVFFPLWRIEFHLLKNEEARSIEFCFEYTKMKCLKIIFKMSVFCCNRWLKLVRFKGPKILRDQKFQISSYIFIFVLEVFLQAASLHMQEKMPLSQPVAPWTLRLAPESEFSCSYQEEKHPWRFFFLKKKNTIKTQSILLPQEQARSSSNHSYSQPHIRGSLHKWSISHPHP